MSTKPNGGNLNEHRVLVAGPQGPVQQEPQAAGLFALREDVVMQPSMKRESRWISAAAVLISLMTIGAVLTFWGVLLWALVRVVLHFT